MSDTIDPVGATATIAGSTTQHVASVHSAGLSATATSAETSSEITLPDGAVTIVVTDAHGHVLSTTTIEASDAQLHAQQPDHILSVEA